MPLSRFTYCRSSIVGILLLSLYIISTHPSDAGIDYRISTVNGSWLMNMTTTLVQGEINGKSEVVCLPRIEFTSEFDREEFKQRLKAGIKKQDVVFHIYHDELNKPIRSGNVLFASDIYLKALKMSYFATLRSWGYKFKVSRQPPFEDRAYVQEVQSQGLIEMAATLKDGQGDTKKTPGSAKAVAGAVGSGGGGGMMSIAHLLPQGYLPPEVRKMKKELDRKLREIKTRPFKAEVISVDPVRWAGGRMGRLLPNGTASGCIIEGRSVAIRLPAPASNTRVKSDACAALASQPCEFILQRDTNGREIFRDGAYVLADLYLTDLGLTWNDWLESQGVTPPPPASDPTYATAPIQLKIQVANGVWQGLKAPALGALTFDAPVPDGLSATEIIRIPPAEQPIRDFKSFSAKLSVDAPPHAPVNITLLLFPDGSPYEEMGQKRAQRIFFPKKQATLLMLMNAANKP